MAEPMILAPGDTFPNPSADLNANITGATQRRFVMKKLDGSPFLDTTANIVVDDAGLGQLHYDWQTGNTDTRGAYLCRFLITFASGDIQTFPQDSDLEVLIRSSDEVVPAGDAVYGGY